MGILIRNVQTLDGRKDIKIEKGKIVSSLNNIDHTIEGENLLALPGFVHAHVHLCQVPFRGWAENVKLFDWLYKHIFLYENKHIKDTLYYGALVGIAEMLLSGTTAIIDMGTTKYHRYILDAIVSSGIRGYSGMSMVDLGEGYPEGFKRDTDDFLKEIEDLIKEYHFNKSAIVGYAVSPRFVPSCSEKLLVESFAIAQEYDALYHTHSAETQDEIDMIKERFNKKNVEYLNDIGVLSDKTVLAHNIYIEDFEMDILKDTKTLSVHCPSTNLKLGSGVADIRKWIDKGMKSGIGADGAPCNNQLDMFAEMKLAGLLQQWKHYPGAVSGKEILDMSTLSLNGIFPNYKQTGNLDIDDTADIILIKTDNPHFPILKEGKIIPEYIVYSSKAQDVSYVIINGNIVVEKGTITTFDYKEAKEKLRESIEKIQY